MDTINKIPNWLRWILSVLCFWVITLLMPYALVIFNNITPYKMVEGSLEYLIFSLIVQPASCAAACFACWHIAPNKNKIVVLINALLSGIIYLLILFTYIVNSSGLKLYISSILSIAALAYSIKYILNPAQ